MTCKTEVKTNEKFQEADSFIEDYQKKIKPWKMNCVTKTLSQII